MFRMARYCTWSTETPSFERCLNIAEPGGYRCSEHIVKKPRRKGDLATQVKNSIRQRDGGVCAVCGSPANEVDHIVELNEFAPDDKWKANLPGNLQLLCFHHHTLKTVQYGKTQISIDDPDDTSTSARNRKKKRRRQQGFYY